MEALKAELENENNWRDNGKDQKTAESVKKIFIDMIARLEKYQPQKRNLLDSEESSVDAGIGII